MTNARSPFAKQIRTLSLDLLNPHLAAAVMLQDRMMPLPEGRATFVVQ
jgi:hypothetical protein